MWGAKALIKAKLDAFASQFNYDMGYAHEILDTGVKAFRAFSGLLTLAAYRHQQLPIAPWVAVKWVATHSEDCGPCQQLAVNMALKEGLPPSLVKAITHGDEQAMGPDVALAYRWARAVIRPNADQDAHDLREQIREKWGNQGLVSLSLAMAGTRSFPMLKRALGHNQACQLLRYDELHRDAP